MFRAILALLFWLFVSFVCFAAFAYMLAITFNSSIWITGPITALAMPGIIYCVWNEKY